MPTENPHTTYRPRTALSASIRVRNQKILSMILELNLTDGASILDFGCGRGDMLRLLGEQIALRGLYGMDIDQKLV